MVIGTTGFSDAQKAEVRAHASHLPMVMAPNMSVGVNVMLQAAGSGGPLAGHRATTSRSSKPTIGTRSTRPAAPRWRWAKRWPTRSAAT
jgi:hypothetical protein